MDTLHCGPILLLGSTGRLGKVILQKLQSYECRILAPTRIELDLSDGLDSIAQKISGYQPTVIINCAAVNGPEYCEDNKDIANQVNNDAVRTIAKYCRMSGSLFVHFSSDYAEYVTNFYAETKKRGEESIQSVNPSHLILRVSSLYGDDFSGPLDVLKQAARGRGSPNNPIQVLHQYCNPISVRFAAESTCKGLENIQIHQWREKTGIYNLVSYVPIWKRDLALATLQYAFKSNKYWAVREGELAIRRPLKCDLKSDSFGLAAIHPIVDMQNTLQNMDKCGLLAQFREPSLLNLTG